MTDDLGLDPTDLDPGDTELARRLGAAAPPAGDADAVLTGLRPRFTRARRRRRAGVVAITMVAVVLLAGVAFAATDATNDAKVRVPPATSPPSTADTGPAPSSPMNATPATTPEGRPASPTTVDDHGGNRGPGGSGDSGSGSNSGSGSGSSGSGSSGSGPSGSGSSGKD